MTDNYPRVKPLGTCPHASCGRGNKACRKLAAGNACLKTHFATHHDWKNFMIARLDDLERFTDALGKLDEEEMWNHDAMFHALCRRIDDRRIKEPVVH
ncbi:MAG TPA: hypothetical protein VJ019_08345 [Aestuariivirga sp.]|jgi:hypothetical protein|nr:hypothetical protein [Aestuariivirga sp.]